MKNSIKSGDWVWVVVQNPGVRSEQLLGQSSPQEKGDFVPMFLEKEEAQKCYHRLVLDKTRDYEIQAIIFEDLSKYAAEGEFSIFLLNGSGEVVDRIIPS